MAQEEDIKQNIILDYKTNALDAAKQVGVLSDSTDAVVDAKQRNTKETKNEEQALKSMKTQVREAVADLNKMSQTYGETSKQAIEAAKKVAQLKDQMQFNADLVEGFNPDRKFQGMATAVNAAAVAASGLTSGMALFGAENVETEKALLKVQAAMAFSDAVGRITEMGDDFMKLKAQIGSMFTALSTAKTVDTTVTEANNASKAKGIVIAETSAVATGTLAGATSLSTIATTAATIATNIFNASLAVLLSPIVLIIAGIAALVAGIGYLTGAFGDFDGSAAKAEKANKALSGELDNLAKSTKKQQEATDLSNYAALSMAKASGKSAAEIRKLSEELLNQEVAQNRTNAVTAYAIYLEAKRVASLEGSTDAEKKTLKKSAEVYNEINDVYKNSIKEKQKLTIDNKVAEVQEATDLKNKLIQDQKELQKKLADEKKQARKKELEDYKKSLKDQRDAELLLQKEIDDAISLATDQNAERFLTEQEVQERAIKDKYFRLLELAQQQGKDILELEIAQANEINDVRKAFDDKKIEDDKTAADKKIEDEKVITEAILAQKQTLVDSEINLAEKSVGFLSAIAGKNKALQKAAIIAENAVGIGKSLIANAAGNSQAASVAAPLIANPVTAPAAIASLAAATLNNNISTAFGVATSIAATAKALSALGGGGSASGGGGSVANSPGGASVPQIGFQSSSENQVATTIANNQNEAAPVQAFVVASEVTTAQQLDRNRINDNSI
jgi:hypothetical protein